MYIQDEKMFEEAMKLREELQKELWSMAEGLVKAGDHESEYVRAAIKKYRPELEEWEVKSLAWDCGTWMWVPSTNCPEEVKRLVEQYNELIVKCQQPGRRYVVYYCTEFDGGCHGTGAHDTVEEALASVDDAEDGAYNFEIWDRKEGKWYKIEWSEEKGDRVMIPK